MGRTIAQFETDLSRKLHGTNLNKVEGKFSLYDEAARAVLNDIDFYETKRTAQIANAIYTDVYDYALPTDLKGNKIFDIRPQVKRGIEDYPQQVYNLNFDRFKEGQNFTIKDNSGVRTLRFSANINPMVSVNTMNSITANGTWAVGDDATNLTVDTLNYIAGSASLNFDVSGATTTASLTNSTMDAVDLSTWEDQGVFFLWVFMPATITNITLTWGSDAANHWADTVTVPQNGTFQVGWNLIRFDWNGAVETLAPDSSAIDYIKISMTYDGNADTDYRVDALTAQLGEIYEIDYYSKMLFQTSAGVFIEEVTDTTNTINLDSEGYNCLLYKTLQLAAPQIQAEDAAFDLQLYTNEYENAKRVYRGKYKSEVRVPTMKYYRKGRNPQSFVGRGGTGRFYNPLHD